MRGDQDGQGADDAPVIAGIYLPVTHWDRPAIVSVDGQRYPCRLIGTIIGRYGAEDGSTGVDLGERTWGAEALGLPADLEGEVTLSVSGATLVKAQLKAGHLAGIGVPWLGDGETLVDGDPADSVPAVHPDA